MKTPDMAIPIPLPPMLVRSQERPHPQMLTRKAFKRLMLNVLKTSGQLGQVIAVCEDHSHEVMNLGGMRFSAVRSLPVDTWIRNMLPRDTMACAMSLARRACKVRSVLPISFCLILSYGHRGDQLFDKQNHTSSHNLHLKLHSRT